MPFVCKSGNCWQSNEKQHYSVKKHFCYLLHLGVCLLKCTSSDWVSCISTSNRSVVLYILVCLSKCMLYLRYQTISLLSVVFERPKVAGFPDPNAEVNATMYYNDFLVTYVYNCYFNTTYSVLLVT